VSALFRARIGQHLETNRCL